MRLRKGRSIRAAVLIAVPMLILAATIEVYVWPHILHALSPVTYSFPA